MLKEQALGCIVALAVTSLVGCAGLPPPGGDPNYAVYVVRRGDTLSGIAERMTGTKDNVWAIASYNGIRNPNRLMEGQSLAIPVNLVTQPASYGPILGPEPSGLPPATVASPGLPPEVEGAIVSTLVGGALSAIVSRGISKSMAPMDGGGPSGGPGGGPGGRSGGPMPISGLSSGDAMLRAR
ncbi:MAG TPA: LysM domain-containing protein [Candidatus Competibacter sp.]|nr:LysM domain-containing protein [Candidatus Competibacter sp.]